MQNWCKFLFNCCVCIIPNIYFFWSTNHINQGPFSTVAEKDTAAVAQAVLGPPKSRRWLPKSHPSAAAGRRGSATAAKTLKSLFSSRMVNWTTLGVRGIDRWVYSEFTPPRVCQKITKRCSGSIERERVYVTYTTLSLSVVVVLVLSRDRKRRLKCCGGRGLVS